MESSKSRSTFFRMWKFREVVHRIMNQLRSKVETRPPRQIGMRSSMRSRSLSPTGIMRTRTSDSLEEDERLQSRVFIALEYIELEQTFNFYVKKVQDPPFHIPGRHKSARARMFVVKDVARTTWMGRTRVVTQQEMEEKGASEYKTLAVKRRNPTIFNEFFSAQVEPENFHRTMLRIQLVDVDRYGREIVTGETDYWIDSNPIQRFTEFALPMAPAQPDLGELEFAMTYLPTAGRIVFSDFKATNLPILTNTRALHLRGNLFIKREMVEEEKGESRKAVCEESTMFHGKLIFDVATTELQHSTIVLAVVEESDTGEQCLGEVLVSHSLPSCDRSHWRTMLSKCREKHVDVHKISPAL